MQSSGSIDIQDLRERIWDYLFETKSSQLVSDLAVLAKCDETTIRIAAKHEWFAVSGDQVSIAHK